MKSRVRFQLGLFSLTLGLAASAAYALATPLPQAAVVQPVVARAATFTVVLQNIVNLSKVIELFAFIFSAYQFWMGRRERRAADVVAAERAKIDSNYQAWQVINSAQGKGGSGGRVEALADLLRNGVSLAGIRLDDAWLEDVQLPRATLVHSSLRHANFNRANLAGALLEGADLTSGEFVAADLRGASLRGANLTDARLSAANLDGADLRDVIGWKEMRSISHASIDNIRNAPAGFEEFARNLGAVDKTSRATIEAEYSPYSREFRAI